MQTSSPPVPNAPSLGAPKPSLLWRGSGAKWAGLSRAGQGPAGPAGKLQPEGRAQHALGQQLISGLVQPWDKRDSERQPREALWPGKAR